MQDLNHEVFYVLYLNQSRKLLKMEQLSSHLRRQLEGKAVHQTRLCMTSGMNSIAFMEKSLPSALISSNRK